MHAMISKSSLTLLVFFIFISTATALVCTGNDTLLQVKYNITADEWKNIKPSFSVQNQPFLDVPGDYITYGNFKDLVDYEACLPRDECSEVVVAGLPTDAYTIFFGGKNVDISADFQFDGTNPVASTEVGTCTKPTCKDTEALVDFQYWARWRGTDSYRVEDQNGNIIIDAPEDYYDSHLTRNRACVPRDNSCYTFLIGSTVQMNPTFIDSPSYNLFYDGKLVRKNDSWLFDSVQFGDACQPRCNQDNESLVEFFSCVYHSHYQDPYEYEWDLMLVTDDIAEPSASGVVQIGPDKSPLYHKTMCVPKDSCSSFHISSPQNASNILTYSLAMDDTTYRKLTWYPDWFPNPQITNMGSCRVGDLCDKQSQDLFDFELHTPDKSKWSSSRHSSNPVHFTNWRFDYSDDSKRDPHFNEVLSSLQYNNEGYDLDSSYRTIECVPKGDCDFAFNITADSAFETYTSKKNGVQLDDRQELPEEFSDTVWIMTPFGQNCFPTATKSRTLSAGAIAGIFIACLVVLIGGIMVCLNRRKGRQNQRDEEDPLSENLL